MQDDPVTQIRLDEVNWAGDFPLSHVATRVLQLTGARRVRPRWDRRFSGTRPWEDTTSSVAPWVLAGAIRQRVVDADLGGREITDGATRKCR